MNVECNGPCLSMSMHTDENCIPLNTMFIIFCRVVSYEYESNFSYMMKLLLLIKYFRKFRKNFQRINGLMCCPGYRVHRFIEGSDYQDSTANKNF